MAQIRTEFTAKDNLSGAFTKIGASAIALNQSLQLAHTAAKALAAPFKAVVSEGASFEQQMSKVKSISKTTAQEFQKLTDEAKRIGETTAFTAVEAGQAMEELRRAGQNTNQVLETTSQAMDLSAATGADLATAAQAAAVQLNIFKDSGIKAKEIVDLMVQTTGASPQSFFQLNEALKRASGTAQAFGLTFQDTTKIIGVLAEAGQTGGRAGTALSGALARLANVTPQAEEAMSKYGITIDQLNPATNKFSDIIDLLNEKNVTQADLFKLLGQEVAPKFFKVIAGGGKAIEDFALKQQQANTASEAAATVLDNLKGDATLFGSAMSGLAINVFEPMKPLLRDVVQLATKMVNEFSAFVKNNEKPLKNVFKGLKEAAGQALIVIGNILKGFANFLEIDAVSSIVQNLADTFFSLVSIAEKVIKAVYGIAEPIARILYPILIVLTDVIITLVEDAVKSLDRHLDFLLTPLKAVGGWLDKVADKFAGANKTAKQFDETIGGNTVNINVGILAERLRTAGDSLIKTGKDFGKADTEAKKLDDTLESVNKSAEKAAASIGKAGGSASGFGGAGSALVQGAAGQVRGVGAGVAAFQKTGDPMAAGAAFGTDFILSNQKVQESLGRLSDTLGEMLDPLIDSLVVLFETISPIIPILKLLTPPIRELAKFIRTLTNKIGLSVEQQEELRKQYDEFIKRISVSSDNMRDLRMSFESTWTQVTAPILLLGSNIKSLVAPMAGIMQPLEDLRNSVNNLDLDFKAGIRRFEEAVNRLQDIIRDPGGSLFGFADGGLITRDRMAAFDPSTGAGLIKAHEGETVVPVGGSMGNTFQFNITGGDSGETSERIRQTIEELILMGKLPRG